MMMPVYCCLLTARTEMRLSLDKRRE